MPVHTSFANFTLSKHAVPRLENGDRLTRDEFERRYSAMPSGVKAELLEGVVYVSPPVSLSHSSPHLILDTWLGVYLAQTPGVKGADSGTVRLDAENEPQPDAFLFIDPECGGQARVDSDDYLEGAPELAVEVAASSASYDLHVKLDVYRRHGVREYLVWRVRDEQIDWFVLRGERYQKLRVDKDGISKSKVFPGLWLDAGALLRGDLAGLLKSLQKGISSSEHAAFVTALSKAREK